MTERAVSAFVGRRPEQSLTAPRVSQSGGNGILARSVYAGSRHCWRPASNGGNCRVLIAGAQRSAEQSAEQYKSTPISDVHKELAMKNKVGICIPPETRAERATSKKEIH
jgi:hypothetical protein